MAEYLVTVIVPAYNHEKYVLECLDSINNQTYRDFQWIVVDDCSTDRTPQILKDYQEKYGYELILHEKNMGIAATLTDTIKNYAKGKYITMCASDDVYLSNRVEEQLRFMQNNPQYGMSYSKLIKINERSEEFSLRDDYSMCRSGHIFEDIICRRYPIGVGVIYCTKVLEELNYYQAGVIAEDFFIYCKIAQKYEIGFLDKYLTKYRVAELSTKRDPWKLVMSHRQTVDMFKDDPLYHKAVRTWEVMTARIIVAYKKHKLKAIWYSLKNSLFFLIHPKITYYFVKYLFLSWK